MNHEEKERPFSGPSRLTPGDIWNSPQSDNLLNQGESGILRSQFVISKIVDPRGGRRYPPYAFTEQGVAMLSSRTPSRTPDV